MSLAQQYHTSFIELDQATEGPVTRFGLCLISLISHLSDLVPLVLVIWHWFHVYIRTLWVPE